MSKKTVMIIAFAVVAVVAAGAVIIDWNGGFDDTASSQAAFVPKEAEIPAKLMEQRGPRPTETRLRDGAKQIEDPAKALEMIGESLKRIDTELSAAAPEDRAALEHKKHLIEQTKTRMEAR